jgi:FkbM family methyltransferase
MNEQEEHLIKFLEIQEALRPEFALEIGCFEASFSKEMAKSGIPSFAFEADPENFKYWSSRNDQPLATYINKAVSDVDGEVFFNKKKDDSVMHGNNSLLLKHNEPIEIEKIPVQSITVDSFIEQNGLENKLFSMWIDVEGVCYEVLNKSLKNIENCQSIYCEAEAFEIWLGQVHYEDLDEYIKGLGFIQVYKESAYDGIQYDLIYINKKYINCLKGVQYFI